MMMGMRSMGRASSLVTTRGMLRMEVRTLGHLRGSPLRTQVLDEPISISLKAASLPWDAEALAEKSFFAQHRPLLSVPQMPPLNPGAGSSWPPRPSFSSGMQQLAGNNWISADSFPPSWMPPSVNELPQMTILDPQSPVQETLQALKILKIRKQKMNKHKWKKRRRDVRNSSRYNKNKRGGDVRKKQE